MTTEVRFRTAAGPARPATEVTADATGQIDPSPRRPRRRWIAAGSVAVALGALGLAGAMLVDERTPPVAAPAASMATGVTASGPNADLAPAWVTTIDPPAAISGPNADLPVDFVRNGASSAGSAATSPSAVHRSGVAACVTVTNSGPNSDLAPAASTASPRTNTVVGRSTSAGPNADLAWDPTGMRSSGQDLRCGRRAPTTQPGA